MKASWLGIGALLGLAGLAAAAPLPKGFAVVPGSISPDRKLGVIAPDLDHAVQTMESRQNELVELATGKVLATIDAPTAPADHNQTTMAPVWAADGSLLVWYVDGKWGSYDLVALCIDHGAVAAQTNVRELAVHEVLADVQRAQPAAAAAAKKLEAGAWFRDGLAIDVKPALAEHVAPKFPLAFAVTFTSNPKNIAPPDFPAAAQLSGSLGVTMVSCKAPLAFAKFAVSRARPKDE